MNRSRWLVALALSVAAVPLALSAAPALAQDEQPWLVHRTTQALTPADPDAPYWKDAPVLQLTLTAQPMIRPRPAATTTDALSVQALHDGERLALRMVWKDTELSEAGHLGEFSDAAAVMFPMHPAESPPPIFMGTQSMPVHIFHWRAQYQRDAERGKPTMKELYPNMSIDMYPLDFADAGSVNPSTAAKDQFSPGRAVGNPQSFAKSGVDEIYAEGFSTSSVQGSAAQGHAVWRDGTWTLVIVRPLKLEGGSSFAPGDKTFAAFAVWQGGLSEVASRKSVTMTWTPVAFEGDAAAPAATAAGESAQSSADGAKP